jgi:hypothetical protein
VFLLGLPSGRLDGDHNFFTLLGNVYFEALSEISYRRGNSAFTSFLSPDLPLAEQHAGTEQALIVPMLSWL